MAIGVSGDGDTGSIGLGQFKHMLRRNVPMVYIVENNGVYGLTKGQFSATADVGQKLKYAGLNELPPIDLCLEAIDRRTAASWPARSRATPSRWRRCSRRRSAIAGTAVLDIISPCVTFNNQDDSTKSYAWGKEHEEAHHDFTYVPAHEEITVDYEPRARSEEVKMHDGSRDPAEEAGQRLRSTDRAQAMRLLEEAREKQQFITGLIYINQERPSLPELERLPETPYNAAVLPALAGAIAFGGGTAYGEKRTRHQSARGATSRTRISHRGGQRERGVALERR